MTLKSSASSFVKSVKTALVRRGSDSALTRSCLTVYCRARGFHIDFGEAISIRKQASVVRLSKPAVYMVPYMLEYFDLYFRSFEVERKNGQAILDFSKPAFHRYSKTGTGFYFPSIPEEEFGPEYTRCYRPKPGDVVFDLGANAGATTWWFSRMVGPGGKVYAFEPDDRNYEFLVRNIEYHGLKNVAPIKKAISDSTGTAAFHMDGTLSSGLAELATYVGASAVREVETITLADACGVLKVVPNFIKMDVEGAEAAIIAQSSGFLKAHPIHFALDSCHIVNGEMTSVILDKLFSAIGYAVRSSAETGQMFTWAAPGASF